jgi:hypothetical protein
LDFELAVINVAEEAFPDSALYGCLFHLMVNMRKTVSDNSLLRDYNSDEEFQLGCRMIPALAFVPTTDVPDAFEALSNHLGERYSPILDWFEKNYVGGLFQSFGFV